MADQLHLSRFAGDIRGHYRRYRWITDRHGISRVRPILLVSLVLQRVSQLGLAENRCCRIVAIDDE